MTWTAVWRLQVAKEICLQAIDLIANGPRKEHLSRTNSRDLKQIVSKCTATVVWIELLMSLEIVDLRWRQVIFLLHLIISRLCLLELALNRLELLMWRGVVLGGGCWTIMPLLWEGETHVVVLNLVVLLRLRWQRALYERGNKGGCWH